MPAATDDATATASVATDTSAKKDIEVRDAWLLLTTQPSEWEQILFVEILSCALQVVQVRRLPVQIKRIEKGCFHPL